MIPIEEMFNPVGIRRPIEPGPMQQPQVPLTGLIRPEAPQAPDDRDYVESMSPMAPRENRGMFGLRGTFRDIIGALGDAFLAQGGSPRAYAARRQREREANALRTMTEDPMGAIQALARENPEAAREMYLRHAEQANQQRLRNEQYRGMVIDRAMRMLGAANEGNYGDVLQYVENYFRESGVQPPVALPRTWDPKAIEGARRLAIPVANQVDDEALADWRDTQDINSDETRAALEGYREGNFERRDRAQRSTDEYRDRTIGLRREQIERPRPVGRAYTGEDGYQYQPMSDGSERRSNQRVRQSGGRRDTRPSGVRFGRDRNTGELLRMTPRGRERQRNGRWIPDTGR